MKIYIVTMYRHGDRNAHNYTIGAWTDFGKAILNGNMEVLWRGKKYYFEVVEVELDKTATSDLLPIVVYTLEQSIKDEEF